MYVCFSALHVAALECIALFEVSKQLQSTGVSGFPKTTSENSSKLLYFLLLQLTPWRNGSASDSRSEGCVFKSRRGHSWSLLNCCWCRLFELQPKFIGRDTQTRPLYLVYNWSCQQGYRRCFFVQKFKLIGIETKASFLDVQRQRRNVSAVVGQSSCTEYWKVETPFSKESNGSWLHSGNDTLSNIIKQETL